MKAKRILASVLSVAFLLQLSPLGVLALDESLPQTPQVSTVQENLDPAPTEEPAATAEPSPEETAAPTAAPTPAPTEEPTAEPTAAPAAESAPDAAETPAPEPSAEPTAAPDPAAEVQAMIDALPDEVTDDNAEAVEQALTDIDDAKESLTDDELAGLDWTRYDAAANALLALWGEAATDEVELLDDNGTPPQKDGKWYLIDTPEKLRWFANQVNNQNRPNINARLTANITMDGTEWTPIGTSQAHPFEGIFDGNGKTITGLKCTDTSKNYVGLVGYADGATIQDVTVKDSDFNGNNYIGAVCGFIVWGRITGCTNSDSTITGRTTNSGSSRDYGRNIGGIAGRAKYTTVQRCVNTGKVTGINGIGGIVGCTEGATVQDCGNTGEVRIAGIGKYYAGIAGYITNSPNYIHNCYNADSITAAKICDDDGYRPSNCYYLADSSDTDPAAKTKTQFASGEVAYLLQGNRAESVWGQTIGSDTYPKLNGETVYQSAPCPSEYSNTEPKTTPHEYVDRKCIYCGESEPPKEVDGYYEIYDQGQLYWFAKLVNGTLMQGMPAKPAANAVLMQAIDITVDTVDTVGTVGKSWPGIGTGDNPYNGRFNGNGYTVTLTDAAQKTLFGTTDEYAALNAICVKGGYLTQIDNSVVTNCYRPEDKPLFQNKAAGSATNCYALGKLVEQESSSATFTNCYAGADSGNGINVMNADAFTNGEVAYKLAEGDPKWGQTLTGANKQDYPVPGGEMVYRSTPCPTDYSNSESQNKDHNIGTNGICTDCGKLCIAYTVTIPATVELGNAASANADITAKDVTLPADKTLKVTINGINGTNGTNGIDSTNDINGTNGINGSNGVFTATLDGTSETVSYKITNGTKELTPGETVLTAASGENSKTTTLTFFKPDNAPYAGSYTGTVTFTVSVVETTH